MSIRRGVKQGCPLSSILFKVSVWQSDWKDWFLLENEFGTVSKYAGVIKAVEFSISLSAGYVADCDAVRADLVYLLCDRMNLWS